MTSPESITVWLEWAKKLDKAGWPKEDSLLCWSKVNIKGDKWELAVVGSSGRGDTELAAPTAEEILRRLPRTINNNADKDHYLCVVGTEYDEEWTISYQQAFARHAHRDIDYIQGKSLANAAAAMYCYLAENHLLPSAA